MASRGAKARDKWAATAREAAKQARRPWIPAVGAGRNNDGGAREPAAAATFVLHEGASTPLTAVELPPAGDIVLVVGPEGGISDEELATFAAAGATAVRLGDSVLRTSTAGVAAICVLSARLGRW